MGLRPIQAKQTMKSKEGKNVKHINANLQLSKIYWDNIWINYHLQNLGKGKWTHKICLKTLQKGVGVGRWTNWWKLKLSFLCRSGNEPGVNSHHSLGAGRPDWIEMWRNMILLTRSGDQGRMDERWKTFHNSMHIYGRLPLDDTTCIAWKFGH